MKAPTHKQALARKRNHLIMRLRGAYYAIEDVVKLYPDHKPETFAAQHHLDILLKSIGAEAEGARRIQRRKELLTL